VKESPAAAGLFFARRACGGTLILFSQVSPFFWLHESRSQKKGEMYLKGR